MTPRTVLVTAPSRLHFGMFSFGQPGERRYGGVGAMIDKPCLRVRISRARELEAVGLLTARAREFAVRYFDALAITDRGYHIEILAAPPNHVGLGVGTQLALSIIAGIRTLAGNPPLDAAKLAAIIGRGERSAIGTHGFDHGGLLVEAGKLEGEIVSPLTAQVAMPETWRFVLVVPRDEQGIHGIDERRAFRDLPPVPKETTRELWRIASDRLVPAAESGHFDGFSESLYQYGLVAGLCFAKFQHGAFASERLQRLVREIRGMGVRGVGQTSWGPTVFALTSDEMAAQKLIQSLRALSELDASDLVIAAPQNHGAKIETE